MKLATSLRVLMAASLLLCGPGGTAWAQTAAGRAAAPVNISGAAGATVLSLPATPIAPLTPVVGLERSPLSNPFPLPAAAPAAAPARAIASPVLPLAAPLAVAPAGELAVGRHPVVEILNQLQRSGVALPESLDSPADAQKLKQAAEALPAGGARDALLKLADVAAAPPGLARQFALDQLFENGVRPAVPVYEAPRVGLWERLARGRLVPSVLKRFAAEKAEARRPKAEPVSPEAYKVRLDRLRWTPAKELLEQAESRPAPQNQIVGQDLALEALEFGLRMPGNGHNVVITGPDGSGRETATRKILERVAPAMETPADLVSVTNFSSREQPLIIQVPAGNGPALEAGLKELTGALKKALPTVLGSGPAAQAKKQIHDEYEAHAAERLKAFQAGLAEVRLAGVFGLMAQPQQDGEGNVSLAVAPTFEGKPIKRGEEQALIDAGKFTREAWEQAQQELQGLAQQVLQAYLGVAEETAQEHAAAHQQMASIDAKVAAQVVGELGAPLRGLALPEPKHEDAAHAEFDKRVKQLRAEYQQSNGSRRIGPFLAVIRMAMTQLGPMPMPQLNKDGQPVTREVLEGMLESGELTMEGFKEIQAEVKKFAKEYLVGLKALEEKLEAEHAELHKNDPKPTETQLQASNYVAELLNRIAKDYQAFLPAPEAEGNPLAKMLAAQKQDPTEAYRVKVLATNQPGAGAPVIFEHSPTFENLMGSVEDSQRVMMMPGAGMVKAEDPAGPQLKSGSFIRANGGFLVLNLMDVLREHGAWQALMRAVRTGQAEIAEGGVAGVLLGRSEKRHAVPVKVKVVLIGSPSLKMLLAENDPDFASHFKAESQFESAMDIGLESVAGYLQFIRRMVATPTADLLELTRDAMVEVLQFGARLSGSNEKLSTKFKPVLDLLTEATYWARQAGRAQVTGQDVETAVQKRWDFEGRLRRRMQEGYWKDVFHVQTEGAAVGQINALTVYGGDFGVPTRATVVVEAGKNGVTGLDRQAGWSGPSYVKGLETLKSFLGFEFGQEKPLPFEVRVSKEQLYGGIDGDSSTSTNMYASLSALSGVPIKQSIAITGSADQFGNVQAIGGVNQKIEGFFDVLTAKLKAAGKQLDGSHGVIIPATNVPDLMLRADVVEAVKAGKFHIWAVTDVRQGIEILTGVAYPEIKHRIMSRSAQVRAGAKGAAKPE